MAMHTYHGGHPHRFVHLEDFSTPVRVTVMVALVAAAIALAVLAVLVTMGGDGAAGQRILIPR